MNGRDQWGHFIELLVIVAHHSLVQMLEGVAVGGVCIVKQFLFLIEQCFLSFCMFQMCEGD